MLILSGKTLDTIKIYKMGKNMQVTNEENKYFPF